MEYSNILIVRTDRIGDVILTLPAIAILRRRYPQARISLLVRRYTLALVAGHRYLDETLVLEDLGSAFSLYNSIRRRRYDAVVFAYPRFRLALLMFLARIPVRIGTGYRWYSMLFNRRVYEHRKDARYHELEYNIHLLGPLGCGPEPSADFSLPIDEGARERVKAFLHRNRFDAADRIIVLHPGSGGSARDWPAERFAALGRQLIGEGFRVILTGAAEEKALVGSVAGHAGAGCLDASGVFTLRELAALYEHALVVVVNSTGPLHIAVAVGTPVIGFYPPIIQCSPRRWGPYTERKLVFEPDPAQCPECAGKPCTSSMCMEQIGVDAVAEGIRKLIKTYSTD